MHNKLFPDYFSRMEWGNFFKLGKTTDYYRVQIKFEFCHLLVGTVVPQRVGVTFNVPFYIICFYLSFRERWIFRSQKSKTKAKDCQWKGKWKEEKSKSRTSIIFMWSMQEKLWHRLCLLWSLRYLVTLCVCANDC